VFSQSIDTNAGRVRKIMTRPLASTPSPIHYLLITYNSTSYCTVYTTGSVAKCAIHKQTLIITDAMNIFIKKTVEVF